MKIPRIGCFNFKQIGDSVWFAVLRIRFVFISALSLAAMMLASCESIPSAYNPFPAAETATKIEPSGPPVPGETTHP
jgi:hypothetical protein